MRRWAICALVFVALPGPASSGGDSPKLISLECQPPDRNPPIEWCQFGPVDGEQWYRARGGIDTVWEINGIRPVPRPVDRLTDTLGLSPYLRPGIRNVLERQPGTDLVVESFARVFVAAVFTQGGRLSVWVENTLPNAASVEVQLDRETRNAYVPPESYEAVEFPLPASDDGGSLPNPITIRLTKFAEAIEGAHFAQQRFRYSPSGKWNSVQAP